jgi:hypothetical protein
MNNPQPILLENHNGSNRVVKNNSLEKLQFLDQNPSGVHNHNNNNNNTNTNTNRESMREKEEVLALAERLGEMEEERVGLLSYI